LENVLIVDEKSLFEYFCDQAPFFWWVYVYGNTIGAKHSEIRAPHLGPQSGVLPSLTSPPHPPYISKMACLQEWAFCFSKHLAFYGGEIAPNKALYKYNMKL
jgi:hypothetical protein